MDNQSFFPFSGQIPNINYGELNSLMKEFSQLMNGDFWNTINQLNGMPNFMPNFSNGQPGAQNRQPGNATQFPIQFNQLNAMMERLNGFLNNDMMKYMYHMNNPHQSSPNPPPPQSQNTATMSRQSNSGTFPIQLWETDRQIFLVGSLPGFKSSQDIKVTLKDETTVKIRAKTPHLQPEKSSRIIESEFPKNSIEREIQLPYPVSTRSYSSQYKDGLLTLILNKLEDDIEISIVDE